MPSTVIYANKPKDFSLWDDHKTVLEDLYLTQKRPLREVKKMMELEHGFPKDITLSTYETTLRDHLGFRKNLKSKDWKAIATHREKRRGKESEVSFFGHRMTHEKVVKETGRHRTRTRNAVIPTRVRTPPLPAGITIGTPPSTPAGTIPDLPASYGISATMTKNELTAASTELFTTTLYGPRLGFLQVVPPPFDPADLERLLNGQFKDAWERLPFNQFAAQLLNLLSSRDHRITDDMMRSLSYLHQMTGSPMVFGLNSSVGVLLHASYMLSNGHMSWDGSESFLKWFGVVADMKLLRAFFSQRTPTVTAAWCALPRAGGRRYETADEVTQTWLEIGLTVMDGRLIAENLAFCCRVLGKPGRSVNPSLMEATKRVWEMISRTNSTVASAHLTKPHLVRWIQEKTLDVAIIDVDVTLMNDLIRQGLPMPSRMKHAQFTWPFSGGPRDNLERAKILVKAGMTVDPKPDGQLRWDGPGKPDLITDWLWIRKQRRYGYEGFFEFYSSYSERMQNCVTVAGICGAASKGLKSLHDYVRDTPHPTSRTKQKLLEVALSEASGQGLKGIVQVLLEYGIDIEVGLLTSRQWQSKRRGDEIRSYEWLPSFRSVLARDVGMIRLLAQHRAILNRQEVMDATFGKGWKPHGRPRRGIDTESVVELLSILGVDIQQYGPKTMLKAVGLLDIRDLGWARADSRFEPDRVLIKALQKYNATWDHGYFSNEEQLSQWWRWDGKKVGGMDLLQAAVRQDECSISTIEYLLGEGMQVHSRPCEVDGRSILQAALEHDHYFDSEDRFKVIHTLIGRVSNLEADPAWPRLLGLSVSKWRPDMRVFRCVEGLGATLLPPTDRYQAKLRFRLMPRLLEAGAEHGTIQAVWGGGTGLDKLKKKDRFSIVLDFIRSGNIHWACTLIEGTDIGTRDWQGLLIYACSGQTCPLWFIRYLLEHGADEGRVKYNVSTALHLAAGYGNMRMASLLMEYGSDFNVVWKPEGRPMPSQDDILHSDDIYLLTGLQPEWTPLDSASVMGRLDMVKFLLHAGGRSGVPGHTGFDGALNLARTLYHGGVVMLLEAWIAGSRD
ncbi:hypothetical protein PG993_002290 [Apiospora rasikravindrae]|uniref:Clr5 domain-containing protein n=1 Tax=Apiospora rasikravindrae TaxID=990691 RepID=A0ABR1TW76_9PEZI